METAEKLITENLDVWTSAIKSKSSAGRGSSKKRELYGVKKLRDLILELAIRGLLVPQDNADEPASKLLEKIAKEKVQLVKSGKLKKQKPLPSFEDVDVPYSVPKGWVWTRIGTIGNIFNGNSISARLKEEKYTGVEGLPFIATKDVSYGFEALDYENGIAIPVGEEKFKVATKDSVLICAEGGSAGKKCGLTDRDICFGNKLFANELHGEIASRFILSVYLSPTFFSAFSRFMTGIIGGISRSKFATLPCALPPLAEQHRIVAKVDELMALCDQLEQEQESSLDTHDTLVATLLGALTTATADASQFAEAWQRIQANFDTLFTTESSIAQLKQTILQLAVMGNLVPQDLEDEPTEKIIDKLILERTRLIQEKQIPKAKKLTAPRDNPFAIPSPWCWTQLGSITHLIEYGTSQKSNDDPSKIPVYRMGDIQDGSLYDEKLKFVPPGIDDLPRLFLEPGDILFNRTNSAELVGKAAIFKGTPNTHTFASYLIRVRVPANFLEPEFINLCFRATYFRETQINPEIIQQCGQANFNGTKLAHTLFPIPPLAEQHRIVAKVDELMTLCERVKTSLKSAQATQLNLADSLVEQAIG